MTTFDRRHALGLAAVAAAAPVIAGCGGPEGGSGQAQAATTPKDKPGATIASTADVPVGGGLIVADQQLVITQPTQGAFEGFSSICTHQQCPVTKVEDGSIDCTCHGSKYSITDGSVVEGPAPRPLDKLPLKVSGGQISLG